MACQQEYHKNVKRWTTAPVAVFGLLLFCSFTASSSHAQIKGTPASVTSPGFGGRAVNGTPPSVTSIGRQGLTQSRTAPNNGHNVDHRRNVHRDPRYGGIYAVPVPYADNAVNDVEDDADYQGGPTIFDRRGSGAQSYIPPVANAPDPHARENAALDPAGDPPEADSAQEITTLVFKDGHQIDVGNYAIVGHTLYDMSPGHPRKVALADLNLDETEKQNDAHGVRFQVPPTSQAN